MRLGAGQLRLAAFAVTVLAGVAFTNAVHARIYAPASGAASSIVLLPSSIDGLSMWRHWDNALGGAVEQGAEYSNAEIGRSVQLDFFRNVRTRHNGALCFVGRGERVRSESVRAVQLHDGAAVFDILVTRAEQQLRLVAATECQAGGCSEEESGVVKPWRHLEMRSLFGGDPQPVVPVSIILMRDLPGEDAQSLAATESVLKQDFERAAAQLDLEPARRLARALQENAE